MFLVKQSSGQCYEVPEITAQVSESELWQLEVDIQGLADHILQTAGQIAEVTPVCTGFELESETINMCMTTLEICLQTDSLVSTADLDVLPAILKIDSNAVLVTDFVQNEGSCIYQILKQPVFETLATCTEVLKIFENDLGMTNKFHLNGTSRLAGSQEGLISMDDRDNLKTEVYCAQSSPMTGLLLQHHQHIQYLQKLFLKITSLMSLFGGNHITNRINDIQACIRQPDIWEAVFQIGRKLQLCLKKIIGKAGIISLDNLKLPGAVNQETQTIDGNDLLMENIFITQSKLKLGFTCIHPELLYIGSNKYNCTHNTVWIAKDTVEAIFTSRGILSSHHYLQFQVESKIHFMNNQVFQLIEDSSDLDHYTPTNATSFEIIMNEFHALPVHQKAGLSIGMGFGLVLFLCSTYCCIRWSNCRGLVQRCAFPCCPADSGKPPANQNVASDADDTQTSFQQNSEDLSRRAFDLIAERVQSLRNSNIL